MRTLIKSVQGTWARFRCDARGNASIFFTIGALAVVGGVGVAVDTSVAYNVRSQLAAAVDAAALAGARNYASPTRDADIQRFFDANFQSDYMGAVLDPLQITPDDENRTITVTAKATIPTFFMSALGTDYTDVAATAEATLSSRDVEVSLVLDITGSMNTGSRIVDLRAAAIELVDIIVQDIQDPFYSKVSLVPYASGVNVGAYANQVRGIITPGTCNYPAAPICEEYRFREAQNSTFKTYDVSTCVTERSGPHLSTDAAPNLAPLGTLYPPPGTYNPCPSATIMPLTSNKTALTTAINALTAAGSTAGQIGVAWGWYMISPNFGYLWPAANRPADYGAVTLGQEVLKVVIIMTDGEFNTIYHSGVNASNSLTPGSGALSYKINQPGTNGSAFDQANALCTAMKAQGIKVYTVGLELGAFPDAEAFVSNCATDAEHVYLPDSGTELKQAFRDIARQVSNLRISM